MPQIRFVGLLLTLCVAACVGPARREPPARTERTDSALSGAEEHEGDTTLAYRSAEIEQLRVTRPSPAL